MKKINFAFALILIVGLGSCTQQNQSADTEKNSTDSTLSSDVTYQCPMKCEGEVSYKNEGKCPECKMDLAKSK